MGKRVYAMIPIALMTAKLDAGVSLPKNSFSANGISDGFVVFETTIKGNPAMNVTEFAKATPTFTLNGLFKVWFSGSYDSDDLVNLGTNRTTFELDFPMAIPLSKYPTHMLWLETMPTVQLYTTNNALAKETQHKK
jgi:hypothetical protein